MIESSRRDLLKGPLAWAALAAFAPARLLAHPHPPAAPSTRRFLEAVAAGDLEAVRAYLDADPGLLHARDASGKSAFAVALLAGHRELGELLRERGYRPDLVEAVLVPDWELFERLAAEAPGLINRDHPVGGTAMYAAAVAGVGTETWYVFKYGADPNANPRGEKGFTPVRAAIDYPDLPTAEITAASLLSNGGDANAPQAGGSSPLHAAAARGSAALVEMLVRKGARVDATDEHGRTPLDLARERGQKEAARLLERHGEIARDHSTSRLAYDVEGGPYQAPDLSAFSPLARNRVVGAAHFDFDEVRRAVERHPELAKAVAATTEVSVEACGHTGRRPIVDYLLERGAPYSLPTAVMRGDLARARALLAEDPLRIHERGPHDFALFWYPVIGGGLLEMAELLVEHSAEVERQHYLGTTALHWAAMGGQTEMAAFLIEHGADVERRGRKFDAAGQTPLEMAAARGHAEVERLLRDRGAKA